MKILANYKGVTEVGEREKDYLKMLAWWSEKKKFILTSCHIQTVTENEFNVNVKEKNWLEKYIGGYFLLMIKVHFFNIKWKKKEFCFCYGWVAPIGINFPQKKT